MVILLCAAIAGAAVLGLRSRGGLTKIVKDQRFGAEERRVALEPNGYIPMRFPQGKGKRLMVQLRNQWTQCGDVFFPVNEETLCTRNEFVCIVPVQAERCRFAVEAEFGSPLDHVTALLYDCGVSKHLPTFYTWFIWRLPYHVPRFLSARPQRVITIEIDLPRMAHNPASTADSGIPLQFQIGRAQPAATDSRRWAYSITPA
jgi:hypothetical protein